MENINAMLPATRIIKNNTAENITNQFLKPDSFLLPDFIFSDILAPSILANLERLYHAWDSKTRMDLPVMPYHTNQK
jgi:hypothetical protein